MESADRLAHRRRSTTGRLLLTLDEAAEQLAVSRRTVYSMIRRGELVDVYPVPGSHRVTEASVLDHVARLVASR
jgi:excisionase family DNA binding protein